MAQPLWVKMFLWIASAYVAWLVVGGILVAMGTFPSFPTGFKGVFITEPDNSTAAADGPYIFYEGDQMIVRKLVWEDHSFVRKEAVFNAKADYPKTVAITLPFEAPASLDVPLRTAHIVPPAVYAAPEKVLAISDIEGNFKEYWNLLRANGVINDRHEWVFGKNHLVLLGDFFDRGLQVTECLWFTYYLEQVAEQAGGRVHFIIGNHELMNMNNQLYHLREKYRQNAFHLGVPYDKWYTPETELGRWLSSKNVMERVGPTLFLHAGLSKSMNALQLPLEKVNELARSHYFAYDKAQRSSDKALQVMYSKSGPWWYRGNMQKTGGSQPVNEGLALYGAERMVLGHSVVPHVSSLYDGRVIGIDTRHKMGRSEGLLIENGQHYRVNANGERASLGF